MVRSKAEKAEQYESVSYYDEASEKSLVACALLNSQLIDEISLKVRPEMFYSGVCRIVFTTCVEMHNANKYIDAVTVSRELKKQKNLADIGGVAGLNDIMGTVPHTAHWDSYSDAVKSDWMRRQALFAGEQIVRSMSDSSCDPETAIAAADRTMVELIESLDSGSKDAVAVKDILFDLEDAWSKGEEECQGIPAHTQTLNRIVRGYRPGQMIIIAARPSVGKTAYALNEIQGWARQKIPGLIISAEQTKLEIVERLLSIEVGACPGDMLKGKVDSLQMEQAKSEMCDWQIIVDDRGGPSIIQVESMARLYKRKIDIQYLVIDYLQLITPADRKAPREQQVAENSSRLKALAKSLQIPVIVLAQLNRQSETRENKRPKLSDLRESGSIEQDADKVILLWRQHMDNLDATDEEKKEAVAIVAKNRNGPVGDAKLVYFGESFRFRERVSEPTGIGQAYSWV